MRECVFHASSSAPASAFTGLQSTRTCLLKHCSRGKARMRAYDRCVVGRRHEHARRIYRPRDSSALLAAIGERRPAVQGSPLRGDLSVGAREPGRRGRHGPGRLCGAAPIRPFRPMSHRVSIAAAGADGSLPERGTASSALIGAGLGVHQPGAEHRITRRRLRTAGHDPLRVGGRLHVTAR